MKLRGRSTSCPGNPRRTLRAKGRLTPLFLFRRASKPLCQRPPSYGHQYAKATLGLPRYAVQKAGSFDNPESASRVLAASGFGSRRKAASGRCAHRCQRCEMALRLYGQLGEKRIEVSSADTEPIHRTNRLLFRSSTSTLMRRKLAATSSIQPRAISERSPDNTAQIGVSLLPSALPRACRRPRARAMSIVQCV